jgi:hypothetical protein
MCTCDSPVCDKDAARLLCDLSVAIIRQRKARNLSSNVSKVTGSILLKITADTQPDCLLTPLLPVVLLFASDSMAYVTKFKSVLIVTRS